MLKSSNLHLPWPILPSVLLTCLHGGLACSSDGIEPGQLPSVTGQLDTGMTFSEVGKTLRIDIAIIEQDSSLARFRWMPDAEGSSKYSITTEVSDGNLHVEFTANEPGRMLLSGRAELPRNGGRPDIIGITIADVRAWGGQSSHPKPAHKALSMVPGEVRHTFAFPIPSAAGPSVYRTLGSGSPTYQIADPDVATIDEAGKVHALTEGTTTIKMHYGDATGSIELRVVPGKIDSPPLGTSLIDNNFAFAIDRGWLRVTPSNRMATDRRGWPVFVGLMNPFAPEEGGEQVVLARWTGSGWGLELVSRPYDAAEEPSLALDDQGGIFVTYRSRSTRSDVIHHELASGDRALVLASRAPGDVAFHYEQLAHALDKDPDIKLARGFGSSVAIAPRRGGGAWLAFTTSGELRTFPSCVDTLHLIEATRASTTAHTVFQRVFTPDIASGGECPKIERNNLLGTDPMLTLLPPRGANSLPSVISAHPWKYDCDPTDIICNLPVNQFSPSGQGFTMENLLRSFDYNSARGDGDFSYSSVSTARDTAGSPGQASVLIALESNQVGSEIGRTIVLNDDGVSWFDTPTSQATFGFQSLGLHFLSGGEFDKETILYADGTSSHAPQGKALHGIQGLVHARGQGPILAWGTSSRQFYRVEHDLGEQLALVTELLPGNMRVGR